MTQIAVANPLLEIRCREDGTEVRLIDRRRGICWELDEQTRYCRLSEDTAPRPLGSGRAWVAGERALIQEFELSGAVIHLEWLLLDDGVEVILTATEPTAVAAASLPGSFRPTAGSLRLALPVMQGVLFDGRGEPFSETLGYGGHNSLSMAMLGYLSEAGGLLLTVESLTDWQATVGKRADGSCYAGVEQLPSLGSLRYSRTSRLYPTDPDLTALCKRYRCRVQERGPWKSWEEKISERPGVARLFGALMAFIGYNQGPFDYVAECGRLRALGFDRAFVYPVRFNTYSQDFLMGGDRPIALDDAAIAGIKALGFDVSPWTWVYEALDDGSDWLDQGYLRNAAGEKIPNWRIDQFQWYHCCTPFQTEFARRQYQGPMAAMTWSHYDVNATVGPRECHGTGHPWHQSRALDRREDLQLLRELLSPTTNGNRVVSSEGVRDCLADVYDVGTTKLLPAWGEASCWTVPMTLLVYHDSLVHDWWELHNYNASGRFEHRSRFGVWRDGAALEKAAMDALYGCPPNVFPFGRQYRWIDIASRKTESYTVRLEDPEVQQALAAALPVARLHRRTGPLEMLSHEFLSEDGAVQATVFSDGTRVAANLANEARPVEGFGLLPGCSWRAT